MPRKKRKRPVRPAEGSAPALTRRGFIGAVAAVGAAIAVDKDRPDPPARPKVPWIGHW